MDVFHGVSHLLPTSMFHKLSWSKKASMAYTHYANLPLHILVQKPFYLPPIRPVPDRRHTRHCSHHVHPSIPFHQSLGNSCSLRCIRQWLFAFSWCQCLWVHYWLSVIWLQWWLRTGWALCWSHTSMSCQSKSNSYCLEANSIVLINRHLARSNPQQQQ